MDNILQENPIGFLIALLCMVGVAALISFIARKNGTANPYGAPRPVALYVVGGALLLLIVVALVVQAAAGPA